MLEKQSRSAAAAVAVLFSIVALPAVLLPAHEAQAGFMRSVARYDDHKALSNDPAYRWSAAVRRTDDYDNQPSVISVASGILIAPDVYINSGHFTPRNGSLVARHNEIVFGENYNTSSDRYSVARTMRFPTFVFGNKSTIDLGIGWTNEFVRGVTSPADLPGFAPYGSIPQGTSLTMVDYGNYGDFNTGELPSIGDRLAGRAPKDNDSVDYTQQYYFSTLFQTTTQDPLLYKGANFASGAAWMMPGKVIGGLLIAGNNTVSIVLDTSHPEIQAYLQPIIQDSWSRYLSSNPVPEPTGALGSFAFLGAAALRRTRRE